MRELVIQQVGSIINSQKLLEIYVTLEGVYQLMSDTLKSPIMKTGGSKCSFLISGKADLVVSVVKSRILKICQLVVLGI